MNVTVVGAGKMGLPLACVFASRGAKVFACDVNAEKVAAINSGQCPFEEPGIGKLLADAVKAGRLTATTDTGAAMANSEVVVVIVLYLLSDSREADLKLIDSVARVAAENLKPGSMICFETTLPVGGTRRLGHIIDNGGMKAGVNYDLAFSPERVKSRLMLKHLFDNPKVVGGITPASAARAEEFYLQYLGAPVTNVGTLEASELVKLAGMIYRDVNIALSNELHPLRGTWGSILSRSARRRTPMAKQICCCPESGRRALHAGLSVFPYQRSESLGNNSRAC